MILLFQKNIAPDPAYIFMTRLREKKFAFTTPWSNIRNTRKNFLIFVEFLICFNHCIKNVRIQNFSGPHFPEFGLNTEIYSVNLCIQSEWGKYGHWYGSEKRKYGNFLRSKLSKTFLLISFQSSSINGGLQASSNLPLWTSKPLDCFKLATKI